MTHFGRLFKHFALYQLEIPQHVVLVLLRRLALKQARLGSRAGVHQATVAVVLVRFDPANIELTVGAKVTVLCQEDDIQPWSEQRSGEPLGESCAEPRAHTCGE